MIPPSGEQAGMTTEDALRQETYTKACAVLERYFPTGWPSVPRLALLTILETHRPDGWNDCSICQAAHEDTDYVPWPCETAQIVLSAALGREP